MAVITMRYPTEALKQSGQKLRTWSYIGSSSTSRMLIIQPILCFGRQRSLFNKSTQSLICNLGQ
jgi:hypothetical protein